MIWERDPYSLVDEREKLDLEAITNLLHGTYWATNRPKEVIAKTIEHSLNFGLFRHNQQVGFARVVTDYTTVGYLCDVVIAPEHRGNGLGRWLLEILLDHPALRTCRIDLFTRDAQEFYRAFGFGPHRYSNLVRYPAGYVGGSTGAPAS
jgi:ribosomal protein S18 acetylase RimI-like enzyme